MGDLPFFVLGSGSDIDNAQLMELINRVSQLELEKADGVQYNSETRELQLLSGGVPIGDIIVVPDDDYSCGVEGDTEWDDMADPSDDSDDGEYWEAM